MKFIKQDGLVVNLETISYFNRQNVENYFCINFYYIKTITTFSYRTKKERDDKFKRLCNILAIEEL